MGRAPASKDIWGVRCNAAIGVSLAIAGRGSLELDCAIICAVEATNIDPPTKSVLHVNDIETPFRWPLIGMLAR